MKTCTITLRLACLLFCWTASALTAFSSVIFVKHDAIGANNGSSWANAYTALQPAINAAVPGDEIWVAAGTYFPTAPHFGGGVRNRTFYIASKNIQLYGGFDGSETMLPERDVVANATVLSGELGAPGNADNALHVMWLDNVSNAMRVDGFTITGGNANIFSFPSNAGGGIFNDRFLGSATSPTIANCTFTNNSAFDGGGLYNYGFFGTSSPVVSNCLFANNSANNGAGIYNRSYGTGGTANPAISGCTFSTNNALRGAAIYNNGDASASGPCTASPTVSDCDFTGNTVTFFGGAIYSEGLSAGGSASPVISNCDFTGNATNENGGAVYSYALNGVSNTSLTGCNFIGNTACSGGAVFNRAHTGGSCTPSMENCLFENNMALCGSGGAVYNHRDGGLFCTPAVLNCTFRSNTAANVGGGLVNDGTTNASTSKCLFAGNSATNNGGAMFNSGTTSGIVNCVFSGNAASNPGAIYLLNLSNGNVRNCSFSGNQGITCLLASGISATLTNCIVWGNSGTVSGFTVNHSTIQGGHAGTGNLNLDPLFVSQPPVGLGTGGDLRLQSCSPAIELGTNTGAPADDFDGNPRPHDADGNATATTDMGAFEFQGSASTATLTALCQNQTVTFSGSTASLAVSLLDGGSTGCTPLSFDVDGQTTLNFDCAGEAGEHVFTLTVTDALGGTATCEATVTVGPDADCDQFGDFCDLCPGGDDGVDNNGDNLPDCKFYPGFANLESEWKCGNNLKKVVVCHNGQTKCFGQGAVAAHLAHGDFLGPCDGAACAQLLAGFGNGDLLDLEAAQSANHVQLYWLNNTGWKNERFILEKSADGIEFAPIGEQGSLSDDSKVKLYQARDGQPGEGANFYRIRLLLQDGSHVFSNIRQVALPFDPLQVQLFPNPASDAAWLFLEKHAGKKGRVQVFDHFGRLLSSQAFDEIPDEVLPLDLRALKDGLYTVTVEAEGFRMQSRRLVVAR